MAKYTNEFNELVGDLLETTAYPGIASANVAQWILESARGSSDLARLHYNFAGLKWRPEMAGYATRVLIDVPSEDEAQYFCSFSSVSRFVLGYWRFLDRAPYVGWKDLATDPYAFIEFIARKGWAADDGYAEKVQNLFAEADRLIAARRAPTSARFATEAAAAGEFPCCPGMADEDDDLRAAQAASVQKPTVRWDPSPFTSSRDGTDIDTIVMHYTTTRSLSSTVDWFKNPNREVLTAAHYVIGRDGEIVQMVKDKDRCIHGNSQISRSIGIEHSAAAGDKFTRKQEDSSVALIRWLMQEYDIKPERIIPHKCAPRSTSCPGDLFKDYGAGGSSDCATHRVAVQKWVAARVLGELAPVA